MGFGMCGATVIPSGPAPETPMQALAALPLQNPIRFYNQHGDMNGGAGSTVRSALYPGPAPQCEQPAFVPALLALLHQDSPKIMM